MAAVCSTMKQYASRCSTAAGTCSAPILVNLDTAIVAVSIFIFCVLVPLLGVA